MEIDPQRRTEGSQTRTPARGIHDGLADVEPGALMAVRAEARAGVRDLMRRVALTRDILNRDDRRR